MWKTVGIRGRYDVGEGCWFLREEKFIILGDSCGFLFFLVIYRIVLGLSF